MRLRARHPGQRLRSRRGQALVEFALILPVLLLLTLGVVDGARVFTAQVSLTNGVREAALFAGVQGNADFWCTDPADKKAEPKFSVGCPGTGHRNPDPNNIAYRIDIEVNELDAIQIVLDPPVCRTDTGAVVLCDAPGASTVTVTAHQPFEVLTPVLSQIWGSTITLKATTTAAILR